MRLRSPRCIQIRCHSSVGEEHGPATLALSHGQNVEVLLSKPLVDSIEA